MPTFQLVVLDPQSKHGTILTRRDGSHRLYTSGKAAARAAKVAMQLPALTGRKVQPRPVADVDWRAREKARFQSGEYQMIHEWVDYSESLFHPLQSSLVFTDPMSPVPDHYAHLAISKRAMVAYTPSNEYGLANKKVVLRPRAYLDRFYVNQLSADAREFLAGCFVRRYDPITLHLASTADQIQYVYENGPRSCMGGEDSTELFRRTLPSHPTRAYAGGDLAVAYIVRERSDTRSDDDYDDDHDANAAVTARALVWPEKKIYGRIYGDPVRMEKALRQAGYRVGMESEWHGARMVCEAIPRSEWSRLGAVRARISESNRTPYAVYVAPYLDRPVRGMNYTEKPGHFTLCADDSNPALRGGSTDGLTLDFNVRCAVCAVRCGTSNVLADDEGVLCNRCRDTGDYVRDDHDHLVPHATAVFLPWREVYWSQRRFRSAGCYCPVTGKATARADMCDVVDGTRVSREAYEAIPVCPACRRRVPAKPANGWECRYTQEHVVAMARAYRTREPICANRNPAVES